MCLIGETYQENPQAGESDDTSIGAATPRRDVAAAGGVSLAVFASTQAATLTGALGEAGLRGVAGRVALSTGAGALELGRRSIRRRRRRRALLATAPRQAWRVPIRDLGVPSSPLAAPWSESGLVPYVERDHHDDLRSTIAREPAVIVVGKDDIGKRRSTHAATAGACGDLRMLAPAEPGPDGESPLAEVMALDAATWRARPYVLLVFKLDRQLETGKVTLKALHAWLARHPKRRLVATMSAGAHELYSGDDNVRLPGSDVVGAAFPYQHPPSWSQDEMARARQDLKGLDPEVRSLSSYLGLGGRQIRRWRNADEASPTGAAIVGAAIDCARANGGVPVAVATVRSLLPSYLQVRPLSGTLDELFDRGLAWTTDDRAHAPLLTRAVSDERVALTVPKVLVDDVAATGKPISSAVLWALRVDARRAATPPPCRGQRSFAAG